MPKNRRYLATRRAAGLCHKCGGPRDGVKKTCEACLEALRQANAEMKTRGVCFCGKVTAAGRRRCVECLAANRETARSRRARNASVGLCCCGGAARAGRKTCQVCADRHLAAVARHQADGLCRCGRRPAMEGKTRCRPCADYQTALAQKLRDEVLTGYGGKCACCGDADRNVLEVDHVNGDGGAHRQELRGSGTTRTYTWALKNRFPPRLQLLCASCHLAKTRTGSCAYRAFRATLPQAA